MKKRFQVAFLILTVAFGWQLILWWIPGSRQIHIAPETTFITEPITAEGLPDYRGWLLQRQRERAEQAGGENGAIPFWQAMWPGDLDDEGQRLLRAELGDELPDQPMPLSDLLPPELKDEIAAWLLQRWTAERDDWDEERREFLGYEAQSMASVVAELAQEQPFSPAEIPPMAAWVQQHQASYALLDSAAACDFFYSPSPTLLKEGNVALLDLQLPTEQAVKAAQQALLIRTNLLIGQGDYQAAWESCRSSLRLANITCQDEMVIPQLIKIARYQLALDQVQSLVYQDNVPVSLLKNILAELQNTHLDIRMVQGLNVGDRMMFLDSLLQMSQGFSGLADGEWGPRAAAGMDWNVAMQRGNEAYDELASVASQQPWAARHLAVTEWEERRNTRSKPPSFFQLAQAPFSRAARTRLIGDVMISVVMPALPAALHAEDRVYADLTLTRVAVALAVYRSEHGEYPPSLDDLQPHIIDKVPTDLFHDAPLQYRRTGNGFLLYSTGPDGQDDLGDSWNRPSLRGLTLSYNAPEAGIADQLRRLLQDDDLEIADDAIEFRSLIKSGSDDIAIRFPRVVRPLPNPRELD